jgi:acetyltransferase-like isoleucine patch superfamily enzyme
MESYRYGDYTFRVDLGKEIHMGDNCPIFSGANIKWTATISFNNRFYFNRGNLFINGNQILKDGYPTQFAEKINNFY